MRLIWLFSVLGHLLQQAKNFECNYSLAPNTVKTNTIVVMDRNSSLYFELRFGLCRLV